MESGCDIYHTLSCEKIKTKLQLKLQHIAERP